MPPTAMTRDQLTDLIREVAGQAVGEMIEERMAKASEANNAQLQAIISRFTGSQPKSDSGTPEKKGLHAARVIRSIAASKGDPDRAIDWARKAYGKDSEAAAQVEKSLSASDATAGGFLVHEDQSAEIIELLQAKTVVRRMGTPTVPMPNGSLVIAKQTAGTNASYIGEVENVKATKLKVGVIRLSSKKLAALVPISNDLLRYASSNADGLVRRDLLRAFRLREDKAFLRDTGTDATPKGLRSWAPAGNLISANGTINLANVTADLAKLILALENADVAFDNPGWVMAPRTKQYLMTVRDGNGNYAFRDEIVRGQLWGFPIGSTTQVPTNLGGGSDESELTFTDFADCIIGESLRLIVEASNEAAYVDENGNLQSAFGRDQTVIKCITEHDFGVRHEESIAVLTGVKWTP